MHTSWVLGARGFIGRHVSRKLASMDMVVSGLGHGAWPQDEAAAWGMGTWINGEVSGANLDLLAEQGKLPTCIYHLAGGSSVAVAQQAPLEDFNRTVVSTASLLEWVRVRAPKTRVILTSSAAVYGMQERQPIRESATLMPTSIYGFHKHSAELLCESYAKNFDISLAVVRPFSVYGAGLRKQLLWDLCVRIERGVDILLGGTGDETRDFVHVEDVVDCMVHTGTRAETLFVNVGSGVARTVRSVAEDLLNAWGVERRLLRFTGKSRPGDPKHLTASIEALKELGFTLKTVWSEAVPAYVEWFKRVRSIE